jgi:hypothetical protein
MKAPIPPVLPSVIDACLGSISFLSTTTKSLGPSVTIDSVNKVDLLFFDMIKLLSQTA